MIPALVIPKRLPATRRLLRHPDTRKIVTGLDCCCEPTDEHVLANCGVLYGFSATIVMPLTVTITVSGFASALFCTFGENCTVFNGTFVPTLAGGTGFCVATANCFRWDYNASGLGSGTLGLVVMATLIGNASDMKWTVWLSAGKSVPPVTCGNTHCFLGSSLPFSGGIFDPIGTHSLAFHDSTNVGVGVCTPPATVTLVAT